MEDDVIFKDLAPLEAAIAELPENWGIIYLGANITDMVFGIKENPPVKHSQHLWRLKRAWTSHAIAYTREAAGRICRVYDPHVNGMYDEFLSSVMLSKLEAFLVNPMVAWQRPVRTDLWGGKMADYTGAFEWGNKYMSK